MVNTEHRTSDVFGVTRELPLNYIERETVDSRLIDYLSRDKHVIIYGSSKQGKTSLRRHCLNNEDFVLVQCQNGWGLEKLAEGILKEVGYQVEVSSQKTVENKSKLIASVSSSLKAFFIGSADVNGTIEGEKNQGATTIFQPLEIDPADPNDLVNALDKINFKKFVVLEDFHYLPHETQEKYAFFLKTLHERSGLCFIIVAVWREENRLIVFNGDLTGRVLSVDADDWKENELHDVIKSGEVLLNVGIPTSFKSDVVKKSLGSVYIVQECCRRVCEDAGINRTQNNYVEISPMKTAEDYVKAIVDESGPRYSAFLNGFAEGFQETQLQMYRWLLYPILTAGVEALEKGISYRQIRECLEKVHPAGETLNAGNITQALASVPALQSKKNIKPFVLDYDQSNKKLTVVDRGFLIWLATQDVDETLYELGLKGGSSGSGGAVSKT